MSSNAAEPMNLLQPSRSFLTLKPGFALLARYRPLILKLALFKAIYLTLVSLAVLAYPSYFAVSQLEQVNSGWLPLEGPGAEAGKQGSFARHFATWDAAHYLSLSMGGYSPEMRACAFYPLWPMLIRIVSFGNSGAQVFVGMVLANILSVAGWTLFYHVTSNRFGDTVAKRALILLIAFPGSLFYQFIYTEPLFFLLTITLFYGLQENRLNVACAAAFLLPLTRAIGLFSLLPIGWHWLTRSPNARPFERFPWLRSERQLAGPPLEAGRKWHVLLAAPIVGMCFYFYLMAYWTGNPFQGFEAQTYWGAHSISNLFNLPKFSASFLDITEWHEFRGSLLDKLAFLPIIYSLVTIWRSGRDLIVWIYILAILPAMSGGFVSFLRYESVAFPVFIGLAIILSKRSSRTAFWSVTMGMAILHLVLLWRFVNYRWAG